MRIAQNLRACCLQCIGIFTYVCLKLKDLLIVVRISERQFLFLRLHTGYWLFWCRIPQNSCQSHYGQCIKGQMSAIVGIA